MMNKQTYVFKVLVAALLMAAMAPNAFADLTIGPGETFGVVFDSVTDDLIAGAVVTLYYDNDPGLGRTWILAVGGPAPGPGVHFDSTANGAGGVAATNPQTTAADGFYAFMTINGDFYLDIAPPGGYVYPSVATSFPAGRTVTTGSKGEVFTVAGAILQIDQSGSLDEYNLNDGIETTLAVAKNEIKYDADVKTEFSEVPPVLCNSGQINQVFLNILVNAAQAIKSQERKDMGTITIKTYAADSEVICEISDDGPGIAPDKLPKIFDPFFFTTKPAGKGTGLGLSVSYDIIVNKHNGQLLVESTVGKGTKFTVKLPVKKEETSNKVVSKV